MAERGQLGPRPDRAEHEARATVGLELLGRFQGQFHRPLVDLEGFVFQPEFAQRDRRGAEGAGLDHVGADPVIAGVNVAHDVGARQHQDIGAVLMPPIIALGIEVHGLNAAAEAAIGEENAGRKQVEKMGHGGKP